MNDLGEDLDLRLVRYFTVVAEHLNFGRAAAELHLAQPSLSRQIQRLEQRLGVRLLERTPRGTLLTEAGKAFLPEARALLHAAQLATVTARAHAPVTGITVGYVEDLIVTPAVTELRRRHPRARIDTRHLSCTEMQALPEGRVDVLIARTPLAFTTGEVRATPLYEESRVLVVPDGHPLAARAAVTTAELAAHPPYPCSVALPGWSAHRLLARDPAPGAAAGNDRPGADAAAAGGGSGHDGPVIESFEDKLELVAADRAIAIVPASDRRRLLRPGLTAVAITDAPASRVVLASRAGDPNPLVRAFRATARQHLTAAA